MSISFRSFLVFGALCAASHAAPRAHAQERVASDSAVVLAAPGDDPVVPTAFARPGTDSLAFDSLRAGMLLRLTAPGVIHRRTGVIESRFADTLLIRGVHERELVRVQRSGIEWAQVSAGRSPSRWTILRGGAIGFVAGLGIARVLQHTLERDGDARDACPVGFSGIDCGMSPPLFISGVTIGTAVGMIIGSRQLTDQWRSVAIR